MTAAAEPDALIEDLTVARPPTDASGCTPTS
jgi:hypothetical protein